MMKIKLSPMVYKAVVSAADEGGVDNLFLVENDYVLMRFDEIRFSNGQVCFFYKEDFIHRLPERFSGNVKCLGGTIMLVAEET